MQKEYIEREAAISILNAKSDMAVGTPKQCFAAAAAMLEKLPAADVVEVVRCKDCRYYRAKNFPLFSGDCFYGVSGERTVFEDHYCGYGEKKMDKEE